MPKPKLKGSMLYISAAANPVELAAEKSDSKARTFRMLAYTGGLLHVGMAPYPVVVDYEGLTITAKSRPIFLNHSTDQIVGHSESIDVIENKMIVNGVVSGTGEAAAEVVASSDKGFPWQASIGAPVHSMQFIDEGESTNVNGQFFEGPIFVARKATLAEVSFVPLGGDDNTEAAMLAASKSDNPDMEYYTMNFEQWLKAMGKDVAKLSEQECKTLQASFDLLAVEGVIPETKEPVKPEPKKLEAAAKKPEPVVLDIKAAQKAASEAGIASYRDEATRCTQIERLCAEYGGDIEVKAKAISDGTKASDYELTVLRASRKSTDFGAPAFSIGGDNKASNDVLEAACVIAGGVGKPEDHFEDKTLEAASKQFKHGIGMQELIMIKAQQNGCHVGFNFAGNHEQILRAAFSTGDIEGILSNVANKSMMDGFLFVERSYGLISKSKNVKDFKTHTTYRLNGDMVYEKLARGGEIKNGTYGETPYTNKADTYAKMLTVDRQDQINDDMGAITEIPFQLGQGAGLSLNDLFWPIFMDNSTFFTAGRGNLSTGAGSALSVAGLDAATTAFDNLADEDGNFIGGDAAIIVVPPSLFTEANNLMTAAEVRGPSTDTDRPTNNPFRGMYRVVKSRYLTKSTITGNSATAWYLLAEPNRLPTIEVAYLNGKETPTIESAAADFNTLGIQMRGYHDFGVALQEYRAGVKSAGS